VLHAESGIWRALPQERERQLHSFVRDYETIRQAEGRGSSDRHYYLALPFRDITGRLSVQWEIRSASYRCLEQRIWAKLEQQHHEALDILDVGAGNAWLCYRVALRGHRPVAVDLLLNEQDGLGAAHHYWECLRQSFPRFQAEMNRLPFADAQFDVVVFNASLHYSVDYAVTLREALRCLRLSGHLVILDSPVYHHEESGLTMIREKHREFEARYGFRSDSVPSQEFLTFGRVKELGAQLQIHWKILRPWYGLKWTLRPLKAKLQSKREPSKFVILWGRKIQHQDTKPRRAFRNEARK
jgi:SAM-dependent methyltransferase